MLPKEKILIIDSDSKKREENEQILKGANYSCIIASEDSAFSALNDDFSGLVLVSMPLTEEQKELVHSLTSRSPRPFFLFLLSEPTPQQASEALELGADELLRTPFTSRDLIAKCDLLAERRRREHIGRPNEASKGELKDVSVRELIELFVLGGGTATTHIQANKQQGSLFFDSGQLIGALFAHHQGIEALIRLLQIDEGSFEITPSLPDNLDNIGKIEGHDPLSIASDALIRWNELLQKLPNLEQILQIDHDLIQEKFSELSELSHQLLWLITVHRTLGALLDALEQNSLEALEELVHLYELGAFKAHSPLSSASTPSSFSSSHNIFGSLQDPIPSSNIYSDFNHLLAAAAEEAAYHLVAASRPLDETSLQQLNSGAYPSFFEFSSESTDKEEDSSFSNVSPDKIPTLLEQLRESREKMPLSASHEEKKDDNTRSTQPKLEAFGGNKPDTPSLNDLLPPNENFPSEEETSSSIFSEASSPSTETPSETNESKLQLDTRPNQITKVIDNDLLELAHETSQAYEGQTTLPDVVVPSEEELDFHKDSNEPPLTELKNSSSTADASQHSFTSNEHFDVTKTDNQEHLVTDLLDSLEQENKTEKNPIAEVVISSEMPSSLDDESQLDSHSSANSSENLQNAPSSLHLNEYPPTPSDAYDFFDPTPPPPSIADLMKDTSLPSQKSDERNAEETALENMEESLLSSLVSQESHHLLDEFIQKELTEQESLNNLEKDEDQTNPSQNIPSEAPPQASLQPQEDDTEPTLPTVPSSSETMEKSSTTATAPQRPVPIVVLEPPIGYASSSEHLEAVSPAPTPSQQETAQLRAVETEKELTKEYHAISHDPEQTTEYRAAPEMETPPSPPKAPSQTLAFGSEEVPHFNSPAPSQSTSQEVLPEGELVQTSAENDSSLNFSPELSHDSLTQLAAQEPEQLQNNEDFSFDPSTPPPASPSTPPPRKKKLSTASLELTDDFFSDYPYDESFTKKHFWPISIFIILVAVGIGIYISLSRQHSSSSKEEKTSQKIVSQLMGTSRTTPVQRPQVPKKTVTLDAGIPETQKEITSSDQPLPDLLPETIQKTSPKKKTPSLATNVPKKRKRIAQKSRRHSRKIRPKKTRTRRTYLARKTRRRSSYPKTNYRRKPRRRRRIRRRGSSKLVAKLLRQAKAQKRRENFRKAEKLLRKALKISPNNIKAIVLLGHVLYERNKANAALRYLLKAYRMSPRQTGTGLVTLGSIYYEKNKFSLAQRYYRQYLKYYPKGRHARDVRSMLQSMN